MGNIEFWLIVMLRRLLPLLIGFAACTWALLMFNWSSIGVALLQFDYFHFLVVGIPLGLFVFLVRTLRWVAVAGLSFRPSALWRAHVQTAIAIATAAATPLQAGEVLKLKMARDDTGAGWAELGAAFALERMADVATLFAIGALAFGLRGTSSFWLVVASLVVALLVALAPAGLRSLARLRLPARIGVALAPLSASRPSPARMAVLGLCTVAKWWGVVVLWQAVFLSAGISLSLADCGMAVVLVTISVTISLVPGGIGVAEVSTQAVLLWLGVEPGLADAGAIMLRLLTPLVIGIGMLHTIALRPSKRSLTHG